MTIATPSAKSHERVTGRWVRELSVKTPREWTIYYIKLVVGTPIPWLLWAFVCLSFLSRAGVEIAAWTCAALTAIYIVADRFTSPREFSFYRVGCDFFLIGYVLVGFISALQAETLSAGFATLGGVRWVLLLYATTYCWELFPGLNRAFLLLVGASCAAAGYGIWQHFTGVDLLRGAELAASPLASAVFFTPISFFNTPEIFGTLMVMALPFPAAAYLLADRRDARLARWTALALCTALSIAVLWTYRPGMWIAAFVGLLVAIIMRARYAAGLLMGLTAIIAATLLLSYGSPNAMFTAVQENEALRAERQRAQINTQVELWQQSLWVGVGRKALDAANYDAGTGNVYFQVLAQSGVLGAGFYFLFVLGFLLATYRIFHEIPSTHYWHRVLIVGGLASQMAFHIAGLYWSTLTEALVVNLFVLIIGAVAYLTEHYVRGLVPDDECL